ncbi:hypothetical protein O7627_00655 [Solwaraspora sp. WMMD1047]|uniref:hypothetical protein n=1 Tax=Solwaraspora sp. WMMD1047 TaxID=3016102 RepID=UPI002416747A|nr:hypothetical protein [Solwaraspora sp. WMMD1047]MDG4827813.1 hypothetical protein [Solwaraspora sp. WMMD1047]
MEDQQASTQDQQPAEDYQGFTERGICYDVGTSYVPGMLSREVLTDEMIRDELTVIRDELHCNAVNLFGSDRDRLVRAGRIARELGLLVWIQPRLIDADQATTIAGVAEMAVAAEELRRQYGEVSFNVGCELTVFMAGIIPGRDFLRRAMRLGWLWVLLPWWNLRLNVVLGRLRKVARANFGGRIGYGAGTWESVNWSDFDVVGLNYYRDKSNKSRYVSDLRGFHRYRKPIVIVEFGCCPYEGADRLGGGGDHIADLAEPPTGEASRPKLKLRRNPRRDERVQADYLAELVGIFEAERVYGSYVFEFIEPLYTYSTDPAEDLDKASFGIVRALPAAEGEPPAWERKAAFAEVARLYGRVPDARR